jgi:U3 small nucleolar RNA-associated protein 21
VIVSLILSCSFTSPTHLTSYSISLHLLTSRLLDTSFINHLKTLSPSAADLEIRSLNPGEDSDELVHFVEALTSRLQQKRDYELVQAWMAVFLRLHGDALSHDVRLVEALRVWRHCQESEGARLGDLVGYCSGVVGFLWSSRTG